MPSVPVRPAGPSYDLMTEIQYGILDQHPPPAINSLKRILSVEDDIIVARAPFGQPDVHDVQLNSATSGQPSRTLLPKRSGWRPPANWIRIVVDHCACIAQKHDDWDRRLKDKRRDARRQGGQSSTRPTDDRSYSRMIDPCRIATMASKAQRAQLPGCSTLRFATNACSRASARVPCATGLRTTGTCDSPSGMLTLSL